MTGVRVSLPLVVSVIERALHPRPERVNRGRP